jgi:hypothetical protein
MAHFDALLPWISVLIIVFVLISRFTFTRDENFNRKFKNLMNSSEISTYKNVSSYSEKFATKNQRRQTLENLQFSWPGKFIFE